MPCGFVNANFFLDMIDRQQAQDCKNVGNRFLTQGNAGQAEQWYRRAIDADPTYAEAFNNLGIALKEQRRYAESLAALEQSVVLNPGLTNAFVNIAATSANLGAYDKAVAMINKALALDPNHASAYNVLGSVLYAQNRLDEADAAFRRALTLVPELGDAHSNLGLVLLRRGEMDAAEQSLRRALEINPLDAGAYLNLGLAMQKQNRVEAAIAAYRQARAINPGNAAAATSEALAHLLAGNWNEGWRLYERRWDTDELLVDKSRFSKPKWLGDQPVTEKIILLHGEQGLGDAIQFVRFVPQVRRLGARLVLEVAPSLKQLFASIPGVEGVYARGEQLPDFDFHCPMMSLPLALSIEPDSIPAEVPYLAALSERIDRWASTIASERGRRVGVVWAGNQRNIIGLDRSIPFGLFREIFTAPADQFFVVNTDISDVDRDALRRYPNVTDLSLEIGDFADTAAVMANLDLVITVDTSVAHVSGAMGKATWTLLPFSADWRWRLNGRDSPWYPTMRLFRQPKFGVWEPVIAEVSLALCSFLS
jgi:tetratricopeptide (TPR) repeat protein